MRKEKNFEENEFETEDSDDWESSNDDSPQSVVCPHCAAETDDESIHCPICQQPILPKNRFNPRFVLTLVLILIVLLLWPILGWVFQPN